MLCMPYHLQLTLRAVQPCRLLSNSRPMNFDVADDRLDAEAKLLTNDELRAVLQEEVTAAQQEGHISASIVQVPAMTMRTTPLLLFGCGRQRGTC